MATRTYKRLELGRYDIPQEALRITEDIVRLKEAQRILKTVDPDNTCEGDTASQEMLWFLIGKLGVMERYAERKLRLKFLSR